MAGIYLHIPFCKKRCMYCDFYSTTREDQKNEYLNAIHRELVWRKPYLKGQPIHTVYFGGGTPSQLSAAQIGSILETINREYDLSHCKEVTLEVNPDDITPHYLSGLQSLPINRLSMGIQTFNDRQLSLLGRRHTAHRAIQAVEDARRAGFENLSVDLMYGLPGQTIESWNADLDRVIQLNVPHISAYHLIYEEGTPLTRMRDERRLAEADEELSLSFFSILIDRLTKAGYVHYEVSNFCLPGMHSRHNSSYWTGELYLGCGASAHSFDGESRQWNAASIGQYIDDIGSGRSCCEREELDLPTCYNEFVITSLRTVWGMSLDKLSRCFGASFYDYCLEQAKPHLRANLMRIEEGVLYINKEGIFVSDAIMSDLLYTEEA